MFFIEKCKQMVSSNATTVGMCMLLFKARIFLLVDLREKNFRFRVEGTKKKADWSFSELFYYFFLISPEQTVKLVWLTNSLY